jgi:arylsulfatase A-like enzyme
MARKHPLASKRPTRIILISMDTVRADAVAGYSEADTPALREIVDDGVVFSDFYAASTYTLPSHMTMMTGLTPIEHGVVNELSRLGRDVPTLASLLADAGYATRAFQEGGYVGARFGFDEGFSEYTKRNGKEVVGVALWGILEWMRQLGDEPYFLFVHTYAAHHPYGGYAGYRSRSPERGLLTDAEIQRLKERYPDKDSFFRDMGAGVLSQELRAKCTVYNALTDLQGALECGSTLFSAAALEGPHLEEDIAAFRFSYAEQIRRIDRAIGEIRQLLIDLGQWDDTLLVVTSDHGESFLDKGLPEHDYSPYNEVLRVPLIMSFPRRLAPGQVIRGLTWHADLLPTILSLAGVEPPPGLRGLDLGPMMVDRQPVPPDRAIFPVLLRVPTRIYFPMRRMVLQGNLKFVEGSETLGDPEGFLFDLESTPDESENLRTKRVADFEALNALVDAHRDSLTEGEPIHQRTGKPMSAQPGLEWDEREISADLRAELEALGYMQPED